MIGNSRQTLLRLFANGRREQAIRHRFALCVHASNCGRLCRWLIKGQGIELIDCYHPKLPHHVKLYPAREDASFACPDEKF